jgi:hypothetical protein
MENFDKIEEQEYIYTVYSKDADNNFKLLRKAFKNKAEAASYAVEKIINVINSIKEDYKIQNDFFCGVLPIKATVIYTLFTGRSDPINKYEYFLENYKDFFKSVGNKEYFLMFYISKHVII